MTPPSSTGAFEMIATGVLFNPRTFFCCSFSFKKLQMKGSYIMHVTGDQLRLDEQRSVIFFIFYFFELFCYIISRSLVYLTCPK